MNAATKNAQISAAIISLRQEGMSMRDAINQVLGAGTYEQIASDLYDALRAKANAA